MFCYKCGKENPEGAAFCNSCAADLRLVPISSKEPEPEPANKPIISPQPAVKKEITLSQVGEAALVFGIIGGVLGVFGGIGGVIVGFIFGFIVGFIISYCVASMIDLFRG